MGCHCGAVIGKAHDAYVPHDLRKEQVSLLSNAHGSSRTLWCGTRRSSVYDTLRMIGHEQKVPLLGVTSRQKLRRTVFYFPLEADAFIILSLSSLHE